MDLSPILTNQRKTLEVDHCFDMDYLSREKEIVYSSPLCIKGIIKDTGRQIEFEATIKTDTLFNCSRCLSDVAIPIELDIKTVLVQEDDTAWDDEYDSFIIEDNNIDLVNIASYEILQSLPMQILCSKDCKGLCSGCGADLNNEECNCKEYGDSRFDILKQLIE